MANCCGRRLSWARLQSAGSNLRFVRSPVAPKITITQGAAVGFESAWFGIDRKSTRLNSSHITISYAVFCLKKKKKNKNSYLLTIIFVLYHAMTCYTFY